MTCDLLADLMKLDIVRGDSQRVRFANAVCADLVAIDPYRHIVVAYCASQANIGKDI